MVLGALGVLAALLLPFAPVLAQQTTVTWPQAGRLPQSTTAFFVPYAPSAVHVDVPCTAIRAGQALHRPATVVASHLPGHDTTGFAITVNRIDLRVLLGGKEVYRAPVAPGNCSMRLDSGQNGSTLRVGAREIPMPGARPLEIQAFSTELPAVRAIGMKVQAQTANWFQNSPATAKLVLIGAQLALALGSLALLAVGDRRRRRLAARPDQAAAPRVIAPRVGRPRLGDLGVLVTLGVWAVLGPRTPDDSFTEAIVRNSLHSGAFTNYYRWENSSEAPFTLVLRILQPLVAADANPLILRLPSVLAGLLVWLLLSRGALPVLLRQQARLFWVRAVLALAFLAWWMPFNLGVRPEPFVALGVTAVLICLLRALARPNGDGLVLLGLGALAAGLTVAASPVAIVVAAPILLLAPRIWRTLTGPDNSPFGWLAALCCVGAVGLVAIFADQSAYGVSRATQLHSYYGPNVAWYQEIRRYEYLLGFGDSAGLARRLPVLITVVLLVCVALLLARGARRLPGMRLAYVAPGVLVLGLLLLWLTPSKWTHYFGALAGFGALAVTTSVVLLTVTARLWSRDRVVVAIGVCGALATTVAAALAFAGKNTWFLFSHFGVPHDDGPFQPLNTPLPWLQLAAILVLLTMLPRYARSRSTSAMLVRMPGVLASVACGVLVAVMLVSFAIAPVRQAGSYSEGAQNITHLTGGDTCGILDRVVTTGDAPRGELRTAQGKAVFDGFTYRAGYPSGSQPPSPPGVAGSTYLWGSVAGGGISTGKLVSQWMSLPKLRRDQELALSVAGRTGDGNRLSLQFAAAAPRVPPRPPRPPHPPRLLGELTIDDTHQDSDEHPEYPADRATVDVPQDRQDWRSPHIEPSQIPRGANLVRVNAVDATTDAGGWIAVTGPRVRDVRPLRDLVRGNDPVYVDLAMLWSAPCVRNLPSATDGLVRAPTLLIKPPAETGFDGEAPFSPQAGGVFLGESQVGSAAVVPTRLAGTEDKPRYTDWGQAVLVTYPMQRDAYDVHTRTVDRWGWAGDRTPVGNVPH